MQQGDKGYPAKNELGAYMVPHFVEFEDIVEAPLVVDDRLRTLSQCGRFEVVEQRDGNQTILRDATGVEVEVDKRD